jgi:hypothetical protein
VQEFYGTKRINAKPMTRAEYNIFRGWELPSNENGDDTGYLVEYLDGGKSNVEGFAGYVSWSPALPFKLAYQPKDALSFGHALVALRAGQKLSRKGWNGAGLYVEACYFAYPDASTDKQKLPFLALHYPAGSNAYPNGAIIPWAASQTDVLANDWQIVE